MSFKAVVLAAGEGRRMRSRQPKVLHKIAGEPMVKHALRALEGLAPDEVVLVVGYGAEEVRRTLGGGYTYAEQKEQLGTAHALLQAKEALESTSDTVLVLYGDGPLIRTETLARMIEYHGERGATLTLLTHRTSGPSDFGRVIREDGRVRAVVEEALASEAQKKIEEINCGLYCFQGDWLWAALPKIELSERGEYYLTDIVAMAAEEGVSIGTFEVEDSEEVLAINNRLQLAQAEAIMRRRILQELMLRGVSIIDLASTFVEAGVSVGEDTVIHPGSVIQGKTKIGRECIIGPYSILREAMVGDSCKVLYSVIEEATLEGGVNIGPFSHLRPGAHLGQGVHIGNFAEVKNSQLGAGVNVSHFSYLGDATIGPGANIGAGTVTCNFDGKRKHRTTIEEGAMIGSDTMLIAPVTVGARAMTGAGSVVTKDIPPETLALGVPARVKRKIRDE